MAHSDIAPARKQDPGELFPWRRLAAGGVGIWVPPSREYEGPVLREGDSGEGVLSLQGDLARWGFGIEASGQFDAATAAVVRAFQRHYRPARIDGQADASTRKTLAPAARILAQNMMFDL